jgi:hypothetical protein
MPQLWPLPPPTLQVMFDCLSHCPVHVRGLSSLTYWKLSGKFLLPENSRWRRSLGLFLSPRLVSSLSEKLAVVLTSAMLLCDISLVIVPLLGLGCDQVAKAQRPLFKVESYHLDENCGEDQLAVQQHLLSITDHCSQSIILFASPQSLKAGLLWAPLLQKLALRKLFTLLVVTRPKLSLCMGTHSDVSSLRCAREF